MTLFDITIAGRRFSVARELHADNQFHQRYSVDGRDVPVQQYLELVATAVATVSMHVTHRLVPYVAAPGSPPC